MSVFETLTGYAIDAINRVMATTADLTHLSDGTTESSVSVVFNEQVGFVDDRRRAVFTLKASDLSADVLRGDYFVLTGETARWYAVDVRDDKAGAIEVRCDGTLSRT